MGEIFYEGLLFCLEGRNLFLCLLTFSWKCGVVVLFLGLFCGEGKKRKRKEKGKEEEKEKEKEKKKKKKKKKKEKEKEKRKRKKKKKKEVEKLMGTNKRFI